MDGKTGKKSYLEPLKNQFLKKHKFHREFQLNGKSFENVSELIEYSNFSEPLHHFLQDWFSNHEFIKVRTSGSTGEPKPIKLKKEFMVNSAKATSDYFVLPQGTKALCCLPIDFIAGKMMVVRALTFGWNLDVIEPVSNPLKETNEVYDFSAMVPLQVMSSLPKLNQIRKLIIGGGVVSDDLIGRLQKLSTLAFATYGMTETITHIAVQKLNHFPDKDKIHTYDALPNINLSIDDRGCLVIDAPSVSSDSVVTNDMVELISKNQFIWKGRFDFVINSGGIKLHPEEIEQKLSSITNLRFFVAGVPDIALGEKLILIIEGKEDVSLVQKINELDTLDNYQIPKEIFFLEKFLETDTGKIKRKKTVQLLN